VWGVGRVLGIVRAGRAIRDEPIAFMRWSGVQVLVRHQAPAVKVRGDEQIKNVSGGHDTEDGWADGS
jgi:hypothetical protein